MKAADQYCNCKRMETFEVYKIIMVSFAVQLLQSQWRTQTRRLGDAVK